MGQEYSESMAAKLIGVKATTLRSWEKHFKIEPNTREDGVKSYTEHHIERLKIVYGLVKERGFTIAGAKKELARSKDFLAKRTKVIKDLQEARNFMVELKDLV